MSAKKTGVAMAMALPTRPPSACPVPVARAFDGTRPIAHARRRILARDAGFEAPAHLPAGREFVRGFPEADRESSEIGRSERRRLRHAGAHDRYAEEVCLELHQQVVS